MEELRQWLSLGNSATVVAGAQHSFYLSKSGEVYACGTNYHGQLGLGDNQNRNPWQRVAVPGRVRKVVATWYRSFLLLESCMPVVITVWGNWGRETQRAETPGTR
jgi:alpha-tubulin suppressor-like RCC1 family protein